MAEAQTTYERDMGEFTQALEDTPLAAATEQVARLLVRQAETSPARGFPDGETISEIITRLLSEPDEDGVVKAEVLARVVVEGVLEGKPEFAKIIMDHLEVLVPFTESMRADGPAKLDELDTLDDDELVMLRDLMRKGGLLAGSLDDVKYRGVDLQVVSP